MKKESILIGVSVLAAVALWALVYATFGDAPVPEEEVVPNVASSTEMVGDDRDEHGCIGSAGYSWCEEKQKCLRIWEESCGTSATTTENPRDGSDVTDDQTNGDTPKPSTFARTKSSCENAGGVWYAYNSSCEINSLTESACEEKGGLYDECNSACRHDPEAEMCTLQCVLTCTFK